MSTLSQSLWACFLVKLLLTPVWANEVDKPDAQRDRGAFAFILDNDLFVGTDQKYTNGVRFSVLTPSANNGASPGLGSRYANALKRALGGLPLVGNPDMRHSATMSLTQFMVTPDDLSATELLPDQAPYLGYLELGTSLFVWNNDQYHEFGAALGVVGPDSGADRTQRFVHRVLGADKPMGWANQVARKYTANVSYNAGHRVLSSHPTSEWQWDTTMSYGLTLGSPNTYASLGALFRWGRNLPRNFNVYFANGGSESALLGLFPNNNRFSWFLYAGIVGNATAYSYIESATKSTHTFDYETLSGSLLIGASVATKSIQLGLSLQSDTSPVKGDRRPITYGSIYFSVPL